VCVYTHVGVFTSAPIFINNNSTFTFCLESQAGQAVFQTHDIFPGNVLLYQCRHSSIFSLIFASYSKGRAESDEERGGIGGWGIFRWHLPFSHPTQISTCMAGNANSDVGYLRGGAVISQINKERNNVQARVKNNPMYN